MPWHSLGRRCDHYFLPFLQIFGVKNCVFLKNQCCDQIFVTTRIVMPNSDAYYSNFDTLSFDILNFYKKHLIVENTKIKNIIRKLQKFSEAFF
jgi:hypothetical protein